MSRGIQRERQVRDWLEDRDYVVVRAAGSLGPVDLVALRSAGMGLDSSRVVFVEVKSTAGGPYERFGPEKRADMLAYAKRAGAACTLAWWPPRGSLIWIPSTDWPLARAMPP